MSKGGGDVGGSGGAVQADHQVAQGGHHPAGRPGTDLGQVFGEGHVADPTQGVLDAAVTADPSGELVKANLMRAQVGDRISGLGAPPARPTGAGADGRVLG